MTHASSFTRVGLIALLILAAALFASPIGMPTAVEAASAPILAQGVTPAWRIRVTSTTIPATASVPAPTTAARSATKHATTIPTTPAT